MKNLPAGLLCVFLAVSSQSSAVCCDEAAKIESDEEATFETEVVDESTRLNDVRKLRTQRLTVYSSVILDWIDDACDLSIKQRRQIKQLSKDIVAEAMKNWESWPSTTAQGGPNADTHVVGFVSATGAAAEADLVHVPALKERLCRLLTEEQQRKLNDATARRARFFNECFASDALNLLDMELCLTSQQRRDLREDVLSVVGELAGASGPVSPQSTLHGPDIVIPFLNAVSKSRQLTPQQQERSAFLSTARDDYTKFRATEIRMSFRGGQDRESWDEQLNKQLQSQRERLSSARTRLAECYAAECEISERDYRRLTVAGKGIIESLLRAWKKKAVSQFEENEHRDFLYYVYHDHPSAIERSSLWRNTLKSLSDSAQAGVQRRGDVRRNADVDTILALLEQELWLTDLQRRTLRDQLKTLIPSGGLQCEKRSVFRSAQLLLIPLFRLDSASLSELNESQKHVLEMMKESFQRNDGGYVYMCGHRIHLAMPN